MTHDRQNQLILSAISSAVELGSNFAEKIGPENQAIKSVNFIIRLSSALLHEITEGQMLGKATHGRKRMELLHDMMEGRDYGQLKDLISDRSRWRQDSKWECMSETCWKQQITKEDA